MSDARGEGETDTLLGLNRLKWGAEYSSSRSCVVDEERDGKPLVILELDEGNKCDMPSRQAPTPLRPASFRRLFPLSI